MGKAWMVMRREGEVGCVGGCGKELVIMLEGGKGSSEETEIEVEDDDWSASVNEEWFSATPT
jgi:hypothetical protein